MMTVSLNNKRVDLASPCSVAEALTAWGYEGQKIAVAVNGAFVPRSEYGQRKLAPNDCVDVVAPVQGG